MSNHVLPMLYFDLGGEMLYVLDQRLRAQKVSSPKGNRVMGEIVSAMFNKSFMNLLFKPQPIYSTVALRTLFEKLVHASIMRVDSDSMEKLYDLMVMTFKHQIIKCHHPRDLLQIALNHFDAILQFVASKPEAKKLVLENYNKTVQLYDDMSLGDLILVKQTLLVFLHDARSKVTIFIRNGAQNRDGTFNIALTGDVPDDTDVPGTIKYFQGKGSVENFSTGSNFEGHKIRDFSVEIGGVRRTRLGMNLYSHDYGEHRPCVLRQDTLEPATQNLAKHELNLLGHLMGATKNESSEHFKLDLFKSQTENMCKVASPTSSDAPKTSPNVLSIKATKSDKGDLSKIMNDFNAATSQTNTDNSDELDLLSLMDNA